MSWMNFVYKLIFHEDESDKSPKVKLLDISKEYQNLSISHDNSERYTLYPNDIAVIATTERSLAITGSTRVSFERINSDPAIMRLNWTSGSDPAFRANRNIGGGSNTVVQIARLSPYVCRITNTAGSTWDLSSVAMNDQIKFAKNTNTYTSPFSLGNQGKTFSIQKAGSNYIDFIDNGIAIEEIVNLSVNFALDLMVFSSIPVKIGDFLNITDSNVHPSNHGVYEITDVSPFYLEFTNPYGVEETNIAVTNTTLVVYDHLIGFVQLRATNKISLRFDSQQEWVSLNRVGCEAILLGSLSVHKIQARNDSPEVVDVSLQHVEVR